MIFRRNPRYKFPGMQDQSGGSERNRKVRHHADSGAGHQREGRLLWTDLDTQTHCRTAAKVKNGENTYLWMNKLRNWGSAPALSQLF